MMIETNLNNFFVFQTKNIGFSQDKIILTKDNKLQLISRKCPNCQKPDIIFNGSKQDNRIIVQELGLTLSKGQYLCKNCKTTGIVRSKELDEWIKQFKVMIKNTIISLAANKLSFERISQHIKDIFGKNISIEWVRQIYNRSIKKLRRSKPKKVSGYFNYDEQHLKRNGKEVVRITIIDAITKTIILDKKFEDKTKETIAQAIKKALKKYKEQINCFICDMDDKYPAVLEELYGKEVKLQWCVFHLFKHINKEFTEGCGYGKAKRKLSLMNEYNKMSLFDIFFNHGKELSFLKRLMKKMEKRKSMLGKSSLSKKENENLILEYEDELRKEYKEYCRTLKKNRRRKGFAKLKKRTYKKALALLEQIKTIIDLYPKKLVSRIRRIIEHWDKFSLGLRDRKVPLTNNNLEQYYSATLHQVEKKRFRSDEAIETRLKVSVLRNNSRKLFGKIDFIEFLRLTSVVSLLFSFG
jgi:hypothetical protein